MTVTLTLTLAPDPDRCRRARRWTTPTSCRSPSSAHAPRARYVCTAALGLTASNPDLDPRLTLARRLTLTLTLSLSSSPRQAIALIEQLTTAHGYASTGESLTIADPDEIW